MILKNKESQLRNFHGYNFDEIKKSTFEVTELLFGVIFNFAYSIFHLLLNNLVSASNTWGYLQERDNNSYHWFKDMIASYCSGENSNKTIEFLNKMEITHPGFDSQIPRFYLDLLDLPSSEFVKEYMIK